MATRGFLAFTDGKVLYPTVIGVIPDGSVGNLIYVANLFLKQVKDLRVLGKVKTLDPDSFKKAIEATINFRNDGWLFEDEYANVPGGGLFCDYGAILNVKDWNCYLGNGKVALSDLTNPDELIKSVKIHGRIQESA